MNFQSFLTEMVRFSLKHSFHPDRFITIDLQKTVTSDLRFTYWLCEIDIARLLFGFLETTDIPYFPVATKTNTFYAICEILPSSVNYVEYLSRFKDHIETAKYWCESLITSLDDKIYEFDIRCFYSFNSESEVTFEYCDDDQMKIIQETVKNTISPEAALHMRSINAHRMALAGRYLTKENISDFAAECVRGLSSAPQPT